LEPDRYVDCSGRLVLECRKCGEELIRLGLIDDWSLEHTTNFECECGESLTLADRRNEETSAIGKSTHDTTKAPHHQDTPPSGNL
jgi:hypothetical protein